MVEAGLKVLVLEPYWGGSHKSVLNGLMRGLPYEWDLMSMPARKWKWRMRLAAPCFAEELGRTDKRYDLLLCSTFVDVAALRSLGPTWLREVPVLTYFHENQFAYPVQEDDERDVHFALTNLTTAMASDSLAFNSRYNLETFLSGVADIIKLAPDMDIADPAPAIKAKSVIISPGLDYADIDAAPEYDNNSRPVVLWNHRWEHDKGPEVFFKALYELDDKGVDFGLIVLGQSFERKPEVFAEARERLAHRTIHFGYAKSRKRYAELLRQGTVAVSTARHEFFGLAVLEAVRAGCRPLLPDALAYPELFEGKYLYKEGGLTEALEEALLKGRLSRVEAMRLTEPHSWQSVLPLYADWLGSAEVAPSRTP